jgi:hypothetical protein
MRSAAALIVLAACAHADSAPVPPQQGATAKMSDCSKTIEPGSSLADAIEHAADGAVLCIKPGSYSVQAVVKKSITLRGLGAAADVVIDGADRASALILDRAAGSVVLEHVTITRAGSSAAGAVKSSAGSLTLRDVVLRGNRTAGEAPGAALAVLTGTAVLEHCVVTDNQGRGIVYVAGNGKLTLRHTAITGNKSVPAKNALVVVREWGQLTLDHATFAGNTADLAFAIWPVADSKPTIDVRDSIVDGGGVLVDPKGEKLVAAHSLLRGDAAGVTDGGGNKTGDPKLAGTGAEPWKPAADSPARKLARDGSTAGAFD